MLEAASAGVPTGIEITAIVTLASVLSPLLLSYLTGRQRRNDKAQESELRMKEKAEDNRRLDEVARRTEEAAVKVGEVAKQAKEAASLLLTRQDEDTIKSDKVAKRLFERQEESAKKVDETASLLAENNKIQGAKLDQIHMLVNSNLTERINSELVAFKGQLVLIKKNIDLERRLAVFMPELATKESDMETQNTLELTIKTVAELEAQLRDREVQTRLASEQLANVEAGKANPKTIEESKKEEK